MAWRTDEFRLTDEALTDLIRYYTKEAGVRGLEREIAKLCRKVITEQALAGQQGSLRLRAREIGPDDLEKFNGVRKFNYGRAETRGPDRRRDWAGLDADGR